MDNFAIEITESVANKRDLNKSQMQKMFELIISGKLTNEQIASFLVALKNKGETYTEIAAAAEVLRKFCIKIDIKNKEYLVDTCGTGGDCVGTFNISTVSAIVSAGSGVRVAKHGNRSVSSKCGSADLLEGLGVNLNMSPKDSAVCLDTLGLAFLFAPLYHPAMKNVANVRRELKTRTIFNILGPLANPAGAKCQLLGVYSKDLADKLAMALLELGSENCMVVSGDDGMDEITTTAKTYVVELKNKKIKKYFLDPMDYGIEKANVDSLRVANVEDAKKMALGVLNKEKSPARDIVLLNAGATAYISQKTSSIEEGIGLARESIDRGYAMDKLKMLVNFKKA